MGTIESHKDLMVWQKGMELAVLVYGLAERFPKREAYGMASQATRAAVSVPANIAEGHARGTRKDYAQFVSIAKGSVMELETYLMLAVRLNYATPNEIAQPMKLIEDLSKMLTSLRKRLLT